MKKLILLTLCSLFLFTGCGKKYDKVTVCEYYDKSDIVTIYGKNDKVYLLESEDFLTFDSLSEAINYEKEMKSTMTTGKNDPKKTLIITRENLTVSMLLKNYAYEKSYQNTVKYYEERKYTCYEK